jgi:hypothetical protein
MSDLLLTIILFAISAVFGALLCAPLSRAAHDDFVQPPLRRPQGVGIGTVRSTDWPIAVDVESTTGQHFVGHLDRPADGALADDVQTGVVLLVTFDPSERERLSLADDMAAVRTAFDQMLVRKGLVTTAQMELIRTGIRARGVVTAMRPTGTVLEDYREVELDLMVRRASGGQFPAHEIALVPASALSEVAPGSVIAAYYRSGDESSVAVCVPPG